MAEQNNKKRKVAILGRYNHTNLGGKLTVLATYSTISDLGFSAKMLRLKDHNDDPELTYNKICRFTQTYVNDPEPPSILNDYFDAFVLCADWTFFKNWFLPPNIRFFDWVKGGKNIISFAASFGTAKGGYAREDHPLLLKRLNRFTSLTVREQSGVDLCKKIGASHAELMYDPVFSQKKDYYLNIAGLSAHKAVPYKYAAVFMLDMDEEEVGIAVKTAESAGLKPFFIIANKDRKKITQIQNYEYASVGPDGISAWIYYLNNADYVITNSFHCLCMTFILGKNFSAIDRKRYPDIRAKSVLSQFDALDKFVTTEEDIPISVRCSVNPELVNIRLDKMYYSSRLFIANAINKKPPVKSSICTDLLPHNLCTGCFSCGCSCPKNCIVPVRDGQSGFMYPQVNKDVCVNCGACAKACPILQKMRPGKENTRVYSGYSLNEEIRYHSTSGGFFSELALSLLNKGNAVVFGAAYETPSTVCHIGITAPEELPKIRQSKYVQSEIRDAYPDIEKHLKNGKTVMFCGTPCQCAAAKQYLEFKKVNTENLYLVDFICHSVNSPYAYSAYLDEIERQYGKAAEQVWFKNKEKSWKQFSTRIDFKNSDNYYLKDRYEDSFCKGFLKHRLFSRPSCHDCQFKGVERVSDITLADAWGIKMESGDNKHGVSTAMIHSEKGKELFESVRSRIYCEEKTPDMVAKGNKHLNNSAKPGKHSDYFYRRLARKVPFSQIIDEIETENFVDTKPAAAADTKSAAFTDIKPIAFTDIKPAADTNADAPAQNTYPNVVVNGAVIRAHPTAQIIVRDGGKLFLNFDRYPGSNAECLIYLKEGAKLIVNGRFKIYHNCRIVVNKNATLTLGTGYINTNTIVSCRKSITIGDAIIGNNCYIIDSDFHAILDKDGNLLNPSAPVKFEGHVWLGQNVTVLKGVTIGNGSCVGAKSLVTKDIPPNCLAAGDPAKVIKTEISWK